MVGLPGGHTVDLGVFKVYRQRGRPPIPPLTPTAS